MRSIAGDRIIHSRPEYVLATIGTLIGFFIGTIDIAVLGAVVGFFGGKTAQSLIWAVSST